MAYLPCGRPCGKQASPWRCNIISAAFRILNDLRVSLHGGHFLKKENNCHSEQCGGEESREQKSLCKYTGSFTLFRMKAYFLLRHTGRRPRRSIRWTREEAERSGRPLRSPGLDVVGNRKKAGYAEARKKRQRIFMQHRSGTDAAAFRLAPKTKSKPGAAGLSWKGGATG